MPKLDRVYPVGDELVDKIRIFAGAYNFALENEFDARGRRNFRYHGDEIGIISVMQGSDGFVAFYLPSDPDGAVKDGNYYRNLSKYSLNEICQSVSASRLKVVSAHIGSASVERPPELDGQTKPIPGLEVRWIHDDVWDAAIASQWTTLPSMAVGPVLHIEDEWET